MKLYDSTSSDGIKNFARRFCKTSSTEYSDNDILASINKWYYKFQTYILEAMDDWDFQGDISTTALVLNQQAYAFPTDILKIKRMEISYDGTNWYKVNFFDINEDSSATNTSSIAKDFDKTQPFADIHDGNIYLFPIPDTTVVSGLKIWYESLVTDLANATDEPTFAKPFHIGLAYGAAIDYLLENLEVGLNSKKLYALQGQLKDTVTSMQNFYRKQIQDRDYPIKTGFVDYEY